jgi:hypothetical protein
VCALKIVEWAEKSKKVFFRSCSTSCWTQCNCYCGSFSVFSETRMSYPLVCFFPIHFFQWNECSCRFYYNHNEIHDNRDDDEIK